MPHENINLLTERRSTSGRRLSTDESKPLREDAERASIDDVRSGRWPAEQAEALKRDPVVPEGFVAEKDALSRLEEEMKIWPRIERNIYEFYYLEGMEPEEIAMVIDQPFSRNGLKSVQARVREAILQKEAVA
jgi:DNA-directed RNA polymerase specialized sigma24 family protein